MKKILRTPYKITVKAAKKVTNLDTILTEYHDLKQENINLKQEVGDISAKLKKLEKDSEFGWPSGHYYSPVHSIDDLKQYKKVQNRSKAKFANTMPGFSSKRMVEEFNSIKRYFKDFDFPESDDGKCRFYSKNVSLSLLDSLTLFSIIRKTKPKRIIEIGSGFSSGLMMEINEKYFDNKIDITFIEPYPELLYQRMDKADKLRYKVIQSGVQEVQLDVFKQLKKGDILFIDSTHVSKFNSDVNYEIFNILPNLEKGVIIHIHDIHDGFEYPRDWLECGWSWNENYILRAFLMHNNAYRVLLANNFISSRYPELVNNLYTKQNKMYTANGEVIIRHDGSLWMEKI